MDRTADPDAGGLPIVFRSLLNKVILSSSLFGGLILFMSGFAAAPEPAVQVLCGIISMFVGYYLVRALRFKVVVEEDGLRIKGFYRSRYLFWDEIESAEVAEFPSLLPWFGEHIKRAEGRTLKVLEVTYLGGTTKPTKYVHVVIESVG